jgi:hypothetical protein
VVEVSPTPTPARPVVAPQKNTPAIPVGSYADIPSIITYWANYYGVSADWMLRVAKCESGFSPTAQNLHYTAGGGHPSGIYQFLPQTFYANAARAGITSPDLWNPDQQAHVAAYMFAHGESKQWQCK